MMIVQHTTVSEALFSRIANRWALVLSINKGRGMRHLTEVTFYRGRRGRYSVENGWRRITVKLY